MNFRARITLVVSALTIALVLAGAWLQLSAIQSRLRQTIADQQMSFVSQVTDTLERGIALRQAALLSAAVSISANSLKDPDGLIAGLASRGALTSLFDGLVIVSGEGVVLADVPSYQSRRGANVRQLAHIQQVLQTGRPVISAPFRGIITGRALLALSVPVFDAQGRVLAILTGQLELDKANFIGSLSRRKVGKNGYFMVVAGNRTLVSAPTPEQLLQTLSAGNNPVLDRAFEGFEGSDEANLADGQSMLMSVRRMRSTGWLVSALLPVDEAYAPIQQARSLMLVLGLLASLLVTAVAWWSTRWFMRPLVQLHDDLQAVRENPETLLSDSCERQDEVGLLARDMRQLLLELDSVHGDARRQATELSSILDAAPVAIMVVVNRVIQQANSAAGRILGVLQSELIHSPVRRFYLNEHDYEEFGRRLYAQVINGSTASYERQFLIADGSVRWMTFHARMVDVRAPEKGLIVILEDIDLRKRQEEQLRENELRYRQMFNNNSSIKLLINPANGDIVDANQAACDFYAHPLGTLLRKRIYDINTLSPEEIQQEMQAASREGRRYFNFRHRLANGEIRDVEVHSGPVVLQGRELLYSIIHDVTQRRQAEEQLHLMARVFEDAHEGIAITDGENRILLINRAFTEITGYLADEVVGKDPKLLKSGRQDESFYVQMWQDLNDDGVWQGEIWNKRKNGEIYPQWLSISAVRGPDNAISHYVAVFSDITERKASEERIRFLAEYDALSGLPNRSLFLDRLGQALVQAPRRPQHYLAVLFVDLDRFKNINDSLGHQIGDQLLLALARRIQACLGPSDTVCRPGGDEFILLLPDLEHPDDAGRLAERLLSQLAQPVLIGSHELNPTASIGIALHPGDGDDADTLIRNADVAMYHAKSAGRNAYQFFKPDMNQRVSDQLSLENNLRRALERRELCLHYQPQVALTANGHQLIGVEALLRWPSPELGMVSPARFIPVAEDSGLIVQLGAWVLMEACRQSRQWMDEGHAPLPVSVNISGVQFAHPQFEQTVLSALAASGLDAALLELELTESVVMKDVERNIQLLGALKARGIRLAIDDFGTGYSSLSYLKRFPLDRLKIDQAFVRDISVDPDDAAITTTIIRMAKTLGLKVIAEGVETAAQLDFLRMQGCDEIQGYYFAKPMASAVLTDFRRQWGDGASGAMAGDENGAYI